MLVWLLKPLFTVAGSMRFTEKCCEHNYVSHLTLTETFEEISSHFLSEICEC